MNKFLLSITGILAIAILALVAYGQRPEATITYGTLQENATTTVESFDVVVDVEQPSTASVSVRTETAAPTPAPENAVACERVTFVVETKTYTPCVSSGMTVFALMQQLTNEGFVFSGQEYPSLGFFVEAINGKKAENGYYWFLYINDASSAEGASTAHVRAGDRIEWRYKVGY